jgi:glycosyltransferase involved in cell wall biosynthesis
MGTRFGFVSTFPPTQCGLATFTAALRGALLDGTGDEGRVVRLVEAPAACAGDEVVAQLVAGDPASLSWAAIQLNQCDVAILQHEYGVYGGADGSEILSLLDQVRVPRVVVLHTVLTDPTPHQRQVLELVLAKADAVVTMTRAARDRLAARYAVDLAKVSIIAHGAPDLHAAPAAAAAAASARRASASPAPAAMTNSASLAKRVPSAGQPTVLTWGLLGPGKGIEWGIEAMAQLRDLRPMPRYIVAGQTHPKVMLHEGEAYRDQLRAQVRRAGLGPWISFDGRYRDASELAALIRSADVVLLPYDSTEQVTSGVLIEAVAAGKPVVATRFPHAGELLAGGAGLVVPHRDPAAIAAALRSVITRGDVLASMASAAAATAPQLLWPAIAGQYRELVGRLIRESVAA